MGKRCTVDPMLTLEEAMLWRLWIWEGCPLSQIVWDSGEVFWPSQQRLGEVVSFFEYSAPIGRDIMRKFGIRERVYGGTGLGLAISSKLASAMGGKMWVESEGTEGLGSTFWFTAKFKLCPSSNHSLRADPEVFKSVRALVVDDNSTSLRILVDLLKSWGMTAHGVESTKAAKLVLENGNGTGQKYTLVLLDMWLSGSEASDLVYYLQRRPSLLKKFQPAANHERKQNMLSHCSQQPSPAVQCNGQEGDTEQEKDLDDSGMLKPLENCEHQDVKIADENLNSVTESHSEETVRSAIIMLTSVNHKDSIRCKELGISAHTSKPIKRSLLSRVLQSTLGIQDKTSFDEGKNVKESKASNKCLHILIVEDNPVNQRVAIKLLHKWGHTTVLAGNGVEAVEQAVTQQFDIILMDVQMPVCDGFEATAKLREIERAQNKRHTPIVAMTAHAMMGDGEYCIAAGMDYYISKPLNAKKLQELLQYVATSSIKVYSVAAA
ncbi:hypothetical protein L7F22_001474 [Adiantum nelumboides]|nr:hypothetical protein [Adiantum nelumboides]